MADTHVTYAEGARAVSHDKHHLICWRSTIAGFFISLLAFTGLVGLGLAVGGMSLSENSTVQGAGIFGGTWFLVSAILALFLGGYASVRFARFTIKEVGSMQGAVVAALFLVVMITQAGSFLGWAGQMTSNAASGVASAVGTGAEMIGQNPALRDGVENALGDLNLKTDPQVVVTGVTTRVLRGDNEGAKNYLARQANMTPAEADQRINAVKADVDAALVKARETSASVMKVTGLSVFLLVLLSSIAACLGGVLGAALNVKRPVLVVENLHVREAYAR